MDNYRSLPPFHDPTLNPKFPEIEDTSLLLILYFVNQRTLWRNIVLASSASSRPRTLLED